MPKKITLLGSTGSIGTQSLDVIRAQGYEVFGLSAHSRTDLLLRQIETFHPKVVCVTDPDAAGRLEGALAGRAGAPVLLRGAEGLRQLAAMDGPDVVLNSVVGIAGLGASLAAIESYLAQYPSIRFILDIHRDAIADSEGNQYKVVSTVEGEGTAAQLTLVMGSDGSGLEHPEWMENLRLAVALQGQILSSYPTLMRPILLRNSRYNQHATTGSLLLEVGAAGNSPEEAALAGRLFARQMAQLLIELGK